MFENIRSPRPEVMTDSMVLDDLDIPPPPKLERSVGVIVEDSRPPTPPPVDLSPPPPKKKRKKRKRKPTKKERIANKVKDILDIKNEKEEGEVTGGEKKEITKEKVKSPSPPPKRKLRNTNTARKGLKKWPTRSI